MSDRLSDLQLKFKKNVSPTFCRLSPFKDSYSAACIFDFDMTLLEKHSSGGGFVIGGTFVPILCYISKKTPSEVRTEIEKIDYREFLGTVKSVVNNSPRSLTSHESFSKDFKEIKESKHKGELYRYIKDRYNKHPNRVVFKITFNEDIILALKKCISSNTIGVGIATGGDADYANKLPPKLRDHFLGGFSFVEKVLRLKKIELQTLQFCSALQPNIRRGFEDFCAKEKHLVVLEDLKKGKLGQLNMLIEMLNINPSKFKFLVVDDREDNVVHKHLPPNMEGFHYIKEDPRVTSKIMARLKSLSLGDDDIVDNSPPSGNEDSGDDSDEHDKGHDIDNVSSTQEKALDDTADTIPSDSDTDDNINNVSSTQEKALGDTADTIPSDSDTEDDIQRRQRQLRRKCSLRRRRQLRRQLRRQ
jgi:hypothetical protein